MMRALESQGMMALICGMVDVIHALMKDCVLGLHGEGVGLMEKRCRRVALGVLSARSMYARHARATGHMIITHIQAIAQVLPASAIYLTDANL
jgi:hypothetical protein